MATQKFIVSILAPAAIGPISEMEYPYEGMKARILGPGACIDVEFLLGGLRTHQWTTLNQVREQLKALWPVMGNRDHGWESIGYHEYDNNDVKASVEMLAMYFEF